MASGRGGIQPECFKTALPFKNSRKARAYRLQNLARSDRRDPGGAGKSNAAMLYRAVRPLLFALDPEAAHSFSLGALDLLTRLGAAPLLSCPVPRIPVRAMGLDFPNPVGLAAGLDK